MQSVDAAAAGGYRESPYLDNYDYDFGDSSFDFSFAHGEQAKMIGDVPGSANSDSVDGETVSDKRAHPDDEDDDESPGNGSKRRESSDKIPKKPGRKPLTSEPTSVCPNSPASRRPANMTLRSVRLRTGPLSAPSESARSSTSRIWRPR
jgi:AP-1-like factor